MITVDGVTYEDVRWGTTTPSAVTIFHKTGIGRIPLEKLSPELQKIFGYDPQKAIEYRQREASAFAQATKQTAKREAAARTQAAQREWAETIARKEQPRYRKIAGKVYDFQPVLKWLDERNKLPVQMIQTRFSGARSVGAGMAGNSEPAAIAARRAKNEIESEKWDGYLVEGEVISIVHEGILLEKPERYKGETSRTIFLRNYPWKSSLVDGATVSTVAFPVGPYTYPTALGGSATVPGYDFGTAPPLDNNVYPITLPSLKLKQ
jgi:hypothetical protein